MATTRAEDLVVNVLDACHRATSRAQRRMLAAIAEADRRQTWRDTGARDLAHWLSMRYGISHWKARRWIEAGHALEGLPRLSEALEHGDLGLDKVVELTRFATPDDEARLIVWAQRVSCAAIRHRGDVVARAQREEVVDVQRSRTLSWWWSDEGRRFGLEAELPAAEGAIVAEAIERVAGRSRRCRTKRIDGGRTPGAPTRSSRSAPMRARPSRVGVDRP